MQSLGVEGRSVGRLRDYGRAGVADLTGTEQWLKSAAADVLAANWLGSSTVPSRALYPHQWSWDSAFIALGLRHLSPERAQRELASDEHYQGNE